MKLSPSWRRLLGASAGALLAPCASCSSSSSSEVPDATDPIDSPIPGFIQTLATTKCGLGADVHEVDQPGDKQWIGSEGVFDVDLANQSSFCETNPFRPLKGPDASAEIGEVKSYFIGVGMPTSQVGPITPAYNTDSSGEQYVSAKVARVVEGEPVPDSSAWAGLVDGSSLGEGVFWPELPASVSSELVEFKALVGDPAKLSRFESTLPVAVLAGSLAIHHTAITARVSGHPAEQVKLVAHVCYDVIIASGPGTGTTECYLIDGHRFNFE